MIIRKHHKYNARRTTVDGIIFHSAKEAKHYRELCRQMKAGEIDAFDRQVRFELVPKQDGERAVNYVADFVTYKDGKRLEVIDVKGMRLPDYVIKRKLLLWVHGIKIKEI